MSTGGERHNRLVQEEFERAAEGFSERTAHRFDALGVVEFSRLEPGEVVVEVGAGSGNFLALFESGSEFRVAVDLTPGMLQVGRRRHPGTEAVAADGARLPLRDRSIDLVCSAQVLHHITKPVPVLLEMRRVAKDSGRVLIVDQLAPERYEQAQALYDLEVLRDPSHAASRPASAFRTIARAAGLAILDERIVSQQTRFSEWMWPGEFPEQRIAAVRAFIEVRGQETGKGFERDGDDWVFTRRRIMLLGCADR
ncbi:MAG: methyltransferase domain-containing protein [Actinomycetota bacterium]|nr:methyltransferase domain-containing protein [Actinomycetota bacterium]